VLGFGRDACLQKIAICPPRRTLPLVEGPKADTLIKKSSNHAHTSTSEKFIQFIPSSIQPGSFFIELGPPGGGGGNVPCRWPPVLPAKSTENRAVGPSTGGGGRGNLTIWALQALPPPRVGAIGVADKKVPVAVTNNLYPWVCGGPLMLAGKTVKCYVPDIKPNPQSTHNPLALFRL
jgi:hypothetical protein